MLVTALKNKREAPEELIYVQSTKLSVFLELNIERENINILIFKDKNTIIFTANFLKQLTVFLIFFSFLQ